MRTRTTRHTTLVLVVHGLPSSHVVVSGANVPVNPPGRQTPATQALFGLQVSGAQSSHAPVSGLQVVQLGHVMGVAMHDPF